MEPGKLDLASSTIDHHAELVKANAVSDESGGDSNKSMSSDDEDFNPDKLEAKDAKEEYDSDPSDTGSDSGGENEGSGGGEKKKAKAEKKSKKAARKATSAPSRRKGGEGGGRKKKKTKLPGQPKKPQGAYFLWLNSEGREKIKEENPGIIVTEVSKKAGEMWAEIGKTIKERFEEEAKAAKKKYDEDYKKWFEDGGEEAIKDAKANKEGEGKSHKKKDWKAVGKASRSPKKSNPTAGRSGKGFKSAEFIKDSGSESDNKKSESDKDAAEDEDVVEKVGKAGKEKH